MNNHKINKVILKKLIKEVLNELEDMGVEPKKDDAMKHSIAAHAKRDDTIVTLSTRGVKPGRAYKKAMAAIAYVAKMADLEVIHADIERGGQKIVSMDAGDLERELPDNFRTDAVKSINRKGISNKERPAFQGSPEEWKALTDKDMKSKFAAKRGVTNGAEDTDSWTDKEWKAWEAQSRAANPDLWAKIDSSDKARLKAEPKPVTDEPESEEEEPEKPVAGN